MPTDRERRELLAECRVTRFRASGPGGQHRNKTETAVRLQHLPTGIMVTCSDTRSQHRNQVLALERLWRRLLARAHRRKPRTKTRVPAAVRARDLAAKRLQAEKKARRRRPAVED
ncbi:MAG: peptide chain release factor-like protein [Acidobacteria bacterium]|nr:peptide chain release factor-like protein [Acidobacteriota bacterium]